MKRREIYMENEISKPGDFEYCPEDDRDFGVDSDEIDAWEDDDFEDDGQPSEYTEWQDFDQDC